MRSRAKAEGRTRHHFQRPNLLCLGDFADLSIEELEHGAELVEGRWWVGEVCDFAQIQESLDNRWMTREVSAQPPRIDQYSLRLFITTATEGSIVRGAEREHIAPSALSRRLTDLEYAFATPLLVRSPKGISLTEAGALVFKRGGKSNRIS